MLNNRESIIFILAVLTLYDSCPKRVLWVAWRLNFNDFAPAVFWVVFMSVTLTDNQFARSHHLPLIGFCGWLFVVAIGTDNLLAFISANYFVNVYKLAVFRT